MHQGFHIRLHEGDDPYADIVVATPHGNTVAKFPLDDAPVHDWNDEQRNRAIRLVELLNSK